MDGHLMATFDVKTALNMNTHKITNVVDPTNDQDAATKKYVDDNAGSGGGSISVSDGSTTVDPASSIVFSGATVTDGGSGEADVAISGGSGIPTDGWISSSGWSYSSADAPTFVIGTSSDLSGTIGVGARIKLTQTTAKYFIVTAIDSTTITVYGGTDYTLANASITSPYWSPVKAPHGFPMDPDKWTITVINDSSQRTQTNPSSGTWYNPGSLSGAIHTGAWQVSMRVTGASARAASASQAQFISLSTANNSESDNEFTFYHAHSLGTFRYNTSWMIKRLTLAAKTTYYLVTKTDAGSQTAIEFRGDYTPSLVKAVCAYL